LIGSGYWARVVHGASVNAHADSELVGVWGRDPERTSAAADELRTRPYADVDSLIGDVEALTFAVPPDVQAPVALRGAARGVHLLLEKPVALSVADASAVERAAEDSGIASIVFFTRRFRPETQSWLERTTELDDWYHGRAESDGNLFVAGNPFSGSTWRREYGPLWDIGPHVLSQLMPVLGEVAAVTAMSGAGHQVHVVFRHVAGGSSTASLSFSSPAVSGSSLYVDGAAGRSIAPADALPTDQVIVAHGAALDALSEQSKRQRPAHPCDIHFGARVVAVLAAAQQALDTGCTVEVAAG
jgi:predicted dehydrogenase